MFPKQFIIAKNHSKISDITQIVNVYKNNRDPESEDKLREYLITKINNIWIDGFEVKGKWIKGVLASSLHNQILISLNINERNDLIDNIYNYNNHNFINANSLDKNAKVLDAFEESQANLLILGEPGSGKTTSLLELTKELLAKAKKNKKQPVPIVLSLASWKNEQTIEQWILLQVQQEYHIQNLEAFCFLMQNNYFVFMLDGLDEVILEYRDKCLLNLNNFNYDKVITCRVIEYQLIKTSVKKENSKKLKMGKAIILSELTKNQIDNYLARLSNYTDLTAIIEILENESAYNSCKVFYTLLKSPLMLDISIIAYENKKIDSLSKAKTIERWKNYTFNEYIKKNFLRKKNKKPINFYLKGLINFNGVSNFSNKNILIWLRNIANLMIVENQATIIKYRLHHEIIETKGIKKKFNRFDHSISALLIVILVLFISLVFIQSTKFHEIQLNFIFLLFLVIIARLFSSFLLKYYFTFNVIREFKKNIKDILKISQIYLLKNIAIMSVLFFVFTMMCSYISCNLVLSINIITIFILAFFYNHVEKNKIELKEDFSVFLTNLLLSSCISISLIEEKTSLDFHSFSDANKEDLAKTLFLIIYILIFYKINLHILFKNYQYYHSDFNKKTLSKNNFLEKITINTGIFQILTKNFFQFAFINTYRIIFILINGILFSLLFLFFFGVDGLKFISYIFRELISISISISFGFLILQLISDISYSYSSRVYLACQNILPLNLNDFLNFNVDRIILQQAGNGYIFIHRLLLEHFANMTDKDIERLVKEIEQDKKFV